MADYPHHPAIRAGPQNAMTTRDFSPDPAIVAALEGALLARNGRERGGEITSTCIEPTRHRNGDQHPSLHYNRKKFVWNCRVCGAKGGFAALAKALGIDWPKRANVKSNAKREGITLAQYAELKQLDPKLLITDGVADMTYHDAPAVWIPAPLPDGTVDGAGQFRVKVKGPGHLISAAGMKARPLGLHRLDLARERGYIVCVEGPSCQQTLTQHGEPALGFPGVGISKDILAQLPEWLDGIPLICVVREPGAPGTTFVQRIASVLPHDSIRVMVL
jgi:hypothetical protein